MDAPDFSRELERIRGGEVEVLNLGKRHFFDLSPALMTGEHIKLITLKLSLNKIGDDGVKSLSSALMNENNKLTTLDVRFNSIGVDGIKSLSTALMNENNKVMLLNLSNNNIGDEGARCLSTALMSENNKVATLKLSGNNIGADGARSLSLVLMNENNKVTILDLASTKVGDDGVKSLSTALMNEKNKVTLLNLWNNDIGTQSLVELLKSLRFSVMKYLIISNQELNREVRTMLDKCIIAFNKYIPRLVCLASVRTIPRIGDQSPHFRELSSDLLIRVVQTLGWFIDLKGTLRTLEAHVEKGT